MHRNLRLWKTVQGDIVPDNTGTYHTRPGMGHYFLIKWVTDGSFLKKSDLKLFIYTHVELKRKDVLTGLYEYNYSGFKEKCVIMIKRLIYILELFFLKHDMRSFIILPKKWVFSFDFLFSI